MGPICGIRLAELWQSRRREGGEEGGRGRKKQSLCITHAHAHTHTHTHTQAPLPVVCVCMYDCDWPEQYCLAASSRSLRLLPGLADWGWEGSRGDRRFVIRFSSPPPPSLSLPRAPSLPFLLRRSFRLCSIPVAALLVVDILYGLFTDMVTSRSFFLSLPF